MIDHSQQKIDKIISNDLKGRKAHWKYPSKNFLLYSFSTA